MVRRRPEEPGALPRARLPLGDIFGWIALVLGVLTMVMLFVWAYSMTCFLSTNYMTCDPMHTLWTPLTWSITLWLAAACGMVGLLIPGLIRCVRPALLGANWCAHSRLAVAHTSRIARLWAGLGITTIAVFPALHPTILTAPILPPILPVSGWGIIALFVVIFGPVFALMVIEFLMRRVWHRAH